MPLASGFDGEDEEGDMDGVSGQRIRGSRKKMLDGDPEAQGYGQRILDRDWNAGSRSRIFDGEAQRSEQTILDGNGEAGSGQRIWTKDLLWRHSSWTQIKDL